MAKMLDCCRLVLLLLAFIFVQGNKHPVYTGEEICNCRYRIFSKPNKTSVYLTEVVKIFSCEDDGDFFDCRMHCQSQPMTKYYDPAFLAMAYFGDVDDDVDIAEAACMLQENNKATVNVYFKVCQLHEMQAGSFQFCCKETQEYAWVHTGDDRCNPTRSII